MRATCQGPFQQPLGWQALWWGHSGQTLGIGINGSLAALPCHESPRKRWTLTGRASMTGRAR